MCWFPAVAASCPLYPSALRAETHVTTAPKLSSTTGQCLYVHLSHVSLAIPSNVALTRAMCARAGAKNMASRGGAAPGGVRGSGHSASEPNLHQDSSSAAWMETQSEGGWDDGAQGGPATQGRGEQQRGQQDKDDGFDSWATREGDAGSRPASGKAAGNFAGFEGLRPALCWHADGLQQSLREHPGLTCWMRAFVHALIGKVVCTMCRCDLGQR